jgi:hypothetical protein
MACELRVAQVGHSNAWCLAGCVSEPLGGNATATTDPPLAGLAQETSVPSQLPGMRVRCGVNECAPLMPSVCSILRGILWQTRRRMPASQWLDGSQYFLRICQTIGVPEIAHVPASSGTLKLADEAPATDPPDSVASSLYDTERSRLAHTVAVIQPGFRALAALLAPLINEIWVASQQEVAKVCCCPLLCL